MYKVLIARLLFMLYQPGAMQPFDFHQAMKTLYNSLNIPATHKKLNFTLELEPKIDEVRSVFVNYNLIRDLQSFLRLRAEHRIGPWDWKNRL